MPRSRVIAATPSWRCWITLSAISMPSANPVGVPSPPSTPRVYTSFNAMSPPAVQLSSTSRALRHATPEQVCQHVQHTAPTVNITTVYRALDLLEELGLVRHTHLGHGAPAYSAQAHEHVHLVCHRCGRVAEVPSDVLNSVAG